MRALPYAAFFLSGASSLIFQAIWTRMLHHTFGATSVAMSSVLTAFMAGLGLGAHLFGKHVARFARPLRVYAICELGVAACALVLPSLVASEGPLASLNAFLRESLGATSTAFMLARFACVLPLLLLPTTLMGGTLPLLAAHFVPKSDGGTSAKVGALYALNTFGAVAGSLLGSFVLMPAIGVQATNLFAVGINAGLGLLILALSQRAPKKQAPPRVSGEGRTPRARVSLPRAVALVAFACSGACAMTYEVVWSRALSMAIGSSLQAFALILVTFLIGIAAGSALLSNVLRKERAGPDLWLFAGCAVVLSLLSLSPAIVLSSAPLALSAWLAISALAAGSSALWSREARTSLLLDPEAALSTRANLARRGRLLLALPALVSVVETLRFATQKSSFEAVSLHGYLPYITAAVVVSLCAFLWLVSALRAAPFYLASATQLFVAAATLSTCVFQDEIPYTFARLVSSVSDLPSHVGMVRFFMFFAAGLCTLPATLGMGAMFPLTLQLWSHEGVQQASSARSVGADVGTVYAANTLGSIVGAWLPGFILLPLVGMQRTLDLGITLNALVAFVVLLAARAASGMSRRLFWPLGVGCVGLLAFMATLLIMPNPPLRWELSHMTLGAFRVSLAKNLLDVRSWGKSDLLYYRDGVSTTVSVERWGRHLSLKNNGKVDASNGDDMPTQIMVAAYPLLLHRKGARGLDVAVVGFGSGVTVGAALQFPVRHVEAMELERAVVEAAVDFFADVSHLPRKHARFPYVDEPRLTLHNDDGRNFLSSTRRRYDVIISEPSNPWITGVSDLFTVEHFRISKRRLKPGGVYCQWVQLYEMSPENVKTIYRTFASQFRHVVAFAAEELSSDTILVGSDEPLPFSVAHVERALSDPRLSRELSRASIHSAYDMWSRVLFASRAEVLAFSQRELRRERGELRDQMRATGQAPCQAPDCIRIPAELNTDDNMRIELGAPSDLIGFARYEGYLSIFYGPDWPYGFLHERLGDVEAPERRAGMALALLAQGRKAHARAFLESLTAQHDNREVARAERVARLLLGDAQEPPVTLLQPEPGPSLPPDVRRAFWTTVARIDQLMAQDDHRAALVAMEGVPELLRALSGPSFRFRYGLLLLRAAEGNRSQLKRAAAELEALIRDDALYAGEHPELYYFLAKAEDGAARFHKAVRNMRAYVERSESR